ncbi:MAG TPA: hypothetical protein VK009_10820 [Chloroflexota bacterium]|nr:hypothetical protein [Chloroflexota bacterium]
MPTVQPGLSACPSGWSCGDVGNPPVAGGQSLNNGAWSLQSSGWDVWGASDQFHFVWQSLSGDGGISARVASQAGSNAWAKAGVMLRASSDPGSPYFAMFVTPSNGILVDVRSAQGGNASQVFNTSGAAPAYLKVDRAGSTYTAYTSSDGSNWTPLTQTSLSMSGAVLAGLATTAGATSLATDTIDSATIITTVQAAGCPTGWTCADIGNPSPVGDQSLSNGTWTIHSGGWDVVSAYDQFHYVSQPLPGDGGISARLISQTNTNPYAKMGLMLRAGADPGAPYYGLFMTPANGLVLDARSSAGANANQVLQFFSELPVYVKVARSGNTFSTYTSSDDTIWTQVPGSAVTISSAGAWTAGIATTSGSHTDTATDVLDSVASPSSTAPPPAAPPIPSQPVQGSATPIPGYLFGTLGTLTSQAGAEHSSGVGVAELDLGWSLYEPEDGVFDPGYAASIKQKLQAFQAAGMRVVLGPGLYYPPSWVFTYPGSRYVNQYGDQSGMLNLTFNALLRTRAELYLDHVRQDLGLQNFWAVRIGAGGDPEINYPAETINGHSNSYWAFDAAAQSGSGLPGSIPTSPMPGWKPGDATYQGQPVTTAQVQKWYDWYLGALVDTVNWQVATFNKLGYGGYKQLVMAGLGSRPDEYATAISQRLNGAGDPNLTMGRGAVWNKVMDGLADRSTTMAYVSSMADGSAGDNVCQPSDSSVSVSDPQVDYWSAARWISYNANRYSMAKMGENPGSPAPNYGPVMMQHAASQMQGCGMQGFMWAHDQDLYTSGSGATLQQYAAVIAQYPH